MNNGILRNRKLRADRAREADELVQAALAAGRVMNPEERTKVDGLLAEVDSLSEQIAAGEAAEKARVDDMLREHGLQTF